LESVGDLRDVVRPVLLEERFRVDAERPETPAVDDVVLDAGFDG